jgi:hypothetical protein
MIYPQLMGVKDASGHVFRAFRNTEALRLSGMGAKRLGLSEVWCCWNKEGSASENPDS